MKFVAGFTLILLLSAGVYWYKSILGIDLFPSFSLSKYLPEDIRKEVRPNRIFKDEVGVLFQDNFDHRDSMKNWNEIPKKKSQEFSYSFGVNALNHTPCLSVLNRSNSEWSLQEHQLIEVTEGDKMNIEGDIRNNIPSESGLGMILFNKNYKVSTVYFAVPDKSLGDMWEHVSLKFRVPKDVYFLRFILNGYGPESVLFDDVKVSRGKI